MRSTLFLLSLTALFAVSCNEVSLSSGDSAALSLNVRTGLESKSIVEGTTLPSGSQIGLFVADESNDTYDGVPYKNVKYIGTGETDSQVWNSENDIMLSATKATLNAYYPYSEGITDVSAIPVTATIDSQTDWMWATPVSNLNSKNYTAGITLNHALANIRFSINKGNYNGPGEISYLSFSSRSAASSALFNAVDGTFYSFSGIGDSYIFPDVFTLSSEALSFDILTIPTGQNSQLIFKIIIDGKTMYAISDYETLASGNIYEFNLSLVSENLIISEISVNEWIGNDLETLEILPPNKITARYKADNIDDNVKLIHASDYWDNDSNPAYDVLEMFVDGTAVPFSTFYNFGDTDEHEVIFIFSRIKNPNHLFFDSDLISVTIDNLTSEDQNYNSMFAFCENLISADLSNMSANDTDDINSMFLSCEKLVEVNFAGWSTPNLIYMDSTFCGCGSLTILDLSMFDTSKVRSMYQCFESCENLQYLDLRNWETSNVKNMSLMLANCYNLACILWGGSLNGDLNLSNVFRDTGINIINSGQQPIFVYEEKNDISDLTQFLPEGWIAYPVPNLDELTL